MPIRVKISSETPKSWFAPHFQNNFVINDDIAGETEEDYEDQLKQEASNETFSVLDTFKEGKKESFKYFKYSMHSSRMGAQ